MSKYKHHVPRLSFVELFKKLNRLGWEQDRDNGGHIILRKPQQIYSICIPKHKELREGIIKKSCKQAGISIEELINIK